MVSYLFATDLQRELAENARTILENELKPEIEKYEAADGGLGVYPMRVHKILADAGYYAMYIPKEWGGPEIDPVTQGIILEEMGKVDAGFTFAFAGSGCCFGQILQTKMSKEKKWEWAQKILGGMMGTLALTEPDAGSDAAAIRTTAVKDGDDWIINGTKCFCSNAPNVEYFLVPAWTDKTKRASQGVTTFQVEKSFGVKIGKKENKMGLHLSETADVIFDNVRVPSDHIVGEVGKGFGTALGGIKGAAALVNSAPNLGMAQAALDEALAYAKTRRQFGKRIVDFQGCGFLIADMEMRTQACRALLYETLAAARDNVKSPLDTIVKPYITDCTMQNCTDAVQVLGGYGYMKDYPVERYMRNAKIFQIFGGTNQIKRKNLLKELAGRDPEYKK